MKLSTTLLTALHLSSYIVAAQPFVIVSTRVQNVLPTPAILPRQDLLDTLNSALSSAFGGGDDDDSSTSAPATVTIPPPATIAVTSSSKGSKHTPSSQKSQSTSDDSQGSASTSSEEGSAATSSTTKQTSTSTTSTSTSTSTSTVPSTTAIPGPSSGLGASSTATPSASADNSDDNGVPAGGVAVAVIMVLLILAVTAFLLFRYHPRCQAWWAAREEKLRQERSYREAIDGPGGSSPTLRQQALSGASSRRRTMLQSFFAPATARLSENTEIRRKPVNWGAPATPAVPKVPQAFAPAEDIDADDEKLSLTASAAPLGQIERYSMVPVATQLPAPPLPPKPLPSPKPLPELKPTYLPVPTSGSFVAELPANVPVISPPRSRPEPEAEPQPTTLMRNLSNPHGFGPPLPAARYQEQAQLPAQPKTPTAQTYPMTLPVSPITLHPQTPSPSLGSVSPISTFTAHSTTPGHLRSVSAMTTSTMSTAYIGVASEVPMLPPLPAIPSLIHAKKGADGVFRLV